MIFESDKMTKAETGEGSSTKARTSTDARMCSTLNKGKKNKSSSKGTKVLNRISTEVATRREEDSMAEEAEGVVEEDFSRDLAFSVCFVERIRATPPSTVRSPFRRRENLKAKKTRIQTSIQEPSNTVQSTTTSQTSMLSPSDIDLRMQQIGRASCRERV